MKGEVDTLAITPDGRFVVSGSWDMTLQCGRLSQESVRVLKGHKIMSLPWRLRQTDVLLFQAAAIKCCDCGISPPENASVFCKAIPIIFPRLQLPLMVALRSQEVGIKLSGSGNSKREPVCGYLKDIRKASKLSRSRLMDIM